MEKVPNMLYRKQYLTLLSSPGGGEESRTPV